MSNFFQKLGKIGAEIDKSTRHFLRDAGDEIERASSRIGDELARVSTREELEEIKIENNAIEATAGAEFSNTELSNDPKMSADIPTTEATKSEQEYHEAYHKAKKHGFCRNDFIRFLITGPQNVGKSCLIQALIYQGQINKVEATTAADIISELLNLITYNMDDKSINEFKKILDNKVNTAIETVRILVKKPSNSLNSQVDDDSQSTTESKDESNSVVMIDNTPIEEEFLNKSVSLDILAKYFQQNRNLQAQFQPDYCRYAKLWDFAGHSIYHVTHQPFLSDHCIYILVLDMSRDIDSYVINREGQELNLTYLDTLQEWLTSIICSRRDQCVTRALIDNAWEEIAWPVIILVGTHADKIGDGQACKLRFSEFTCKLRQEFPAYAKNIYGSGLIFNCDDLDNTTGVIEQRQRDCSVLHNIMKQFVINSPIIDNFSKIPIRWYPMVALLHNFSNIKDAESANGDYQQVEAISKIISTEDVQRLAEKHYLCDKDEDIRMMLSYLHDIGEIVYCRKGSAKGMIVTQVEWLLNIFRSIIQLRKPHTKGLATTDEYEKARNTGIMSFSYIDFQLNKLNVAEDEKKYILDLMESHDMICKINSNNLDSTSENVQYYVPYLFRWISQDIDSSQFKTSNWLYIGYERCHIPYIPDGILFCLLISCLKEWKNCIIEPGYKCAKYRFKDDYYDIIIKKVKSYIALQYRYRDLSDNPELQEEIEQKMTESIQKNKPYEFVRHKIELLIEERMPTCHPFRSHYFTRCPHCQAFNMIEKSLENSGKIFCDCNEIYDHASSHGWIAACTLNKTKVSRKLARFKSDDNLKESNLNNLLHNESKRNQCFITIADNMNGKKLKEFGWRLGLSSIDVGDIVDSNEERFAKCMKLLEAWHLKFASKGNKDSLLEALNSCKLANISDRLIKIFTIDDKN
ncbi:uncharacterized protein TRIADDRAFT_61416 [Trichoplax adhaerens]|uniref:Death domain-containing protein n=1 Tax=Trichoplax adhaerens TaxID=10228 RepID=B3SAX7_TRIAD|nr:predicted protein [Trichoplax adhaerens]EDV20006.1 predicted protein [Trichoplax adhaerens]|eukprot:XP_002117390.1 predicted protein [Trichoplax adhaerens]